MIMKKINYLNLVGKEMTAKKMELVKGGTSDSGGTCSGKGCGSDTNVMANKLMANFKSVNNDLLIKINNPNDSTAVPPDSIH